MPEIQRLFRTLWLLDGRIAKKGAGPSERAAIAAEFAATVTKLCRLLDEEAVRSEIDERIAATAILEPAHAQHILRSIRRPDWALELRICAAYGLERPKARRLLTRASRQLDSYVDRGLAVRPAPNTARIIELLKRAGDSVQLSAVASGRTGISGRRFWRKDRELALGQSTLVVANALRPANFSVSYAFSVGLAG